jgi:hypothetical protein
MRRELELATCTPNAGETCGFKLGIAIDQLLSRSELQTSFRLFTLNDNPTGDRSLPTALISLSSKPHPWSLDRSSSLRKKHPNIVAKTQTPTVPQDGLELQDPQRCLSLGCAEGERKASTVA